MTRRLILLDMTIAEYFTLRNALGDVALDPDASKRDKGKASRLLEKIDSIWDAKGREGRGNDTRIPKRPPPRGE